VLKASQAGSIASLPEKDIANEAVKRAMQAENTLGKLVPQSHESQLFALLGDSKQIAQVLDCHAGDVKAIQRFANQEGTMTIEVVCTGEASHSPEECVARGIAAHPGNNNNVAGGAHSRMKQLATLLRYLIRGGYTLHDTNGILTACKEDPRKRSLQQSKVFSSARDEMKHEPLAKLVTTGCTSHFDNVFGRRLRQSEALMFLENAAEYSLNSCHTLQCFALEALVDEWQRWGVEGCGTAMLSCNDLETISKTSTDQVVQLGSMPAKALEEARASLQGVYTMLGTHVPFERIPDIARSAVRAVVHKRNIQLDDLLKDSLELWPALREVAQQYKSSGDTEAKDDTVYEAADLVITDSSEDVAHHAKAIKQRGTANAFESPDDICALFTEAFFDFSGKLAKLGSQDELDVAKAAVVLDTAGLWNNASDCMRARAKSKGLPRSAAPEKKTGDPFCE